MKTVLYTTTSEAFADAITANLDAIGDVMGSDLENIKTMKRNLEAIQKGLEALATLELGEAYLLPQSDQPIKYDEPEFFNSNIFGIKQLNNMLAEAIELMEPIFTDICTATTEFDPQTLEDLEESDSQYYTRLTY